MYRGPLFTSYDVARRRTTSYRCTGAIFSHHTYRGPFFTSYRCTGVHFSHHADAVERHRTGVLVSLFSHRTTSLNVVRHCAGIQGSIIHFARRRGASYNFVHVYRGPFYTSTGLIYIYIGGQPAVLKVARFLLLRVMFFLKKRGH